MNSRDYKSFFLLTGKIIAVSAAIGGAVFLLRLGAFLRDSSFGAIPMHRVIVAVRDNYFEPRQVRVKFGDMVVWKNEGLRAHTVTFRAISKTLFPGEHWAWKIEQNLFAAGENPYWDEIWRKDGIEGTLIAE